MFDMPSGAYALAVLGALPTGFVVNTTYLHLPSKFISSDNDWRCFMKNSLVPATRCVQRYRDCKEGYVTASGTMIVGNHDDSVDISWVWSCGHYRLLQSSADLWPCNYTSCNEKPCSNYGNTTICSVAFERPQELLEIRTANQTGILTVTRDSYYDAHLESYTYGFVWGCLTCILAVVILVYGQKNKSSRTENLSEKSPLVLNSTRKGDYIYV